MAQDFLGTLLGNQARARLLRALTLDPEKLFTLGEAAKCATASSRVALRELKALEKLGVIRRTLGPHLERTSKRETRRPRGKRVASAQGEVAWQFDASCKYARALSVFIHEVAPMRHDAVLTVLRRSGKLSAVVLSGFFLGDASRPADLVVVGDPLHEARVEAAVRSLEAKVGREIRYAAFSTPELRYRLTIQDRLLRDTLDYPHLVLLDRTRLL